MTSSEMYVRDDMEVEVPSPVTVIQLDAWAVLGKLSIWNILQEATSTHHAIPITKLANVLKIHRHTLEHEIERNGVTCQFAALSDCDLDRLVKVFKSTKPDSGICYLVGFLCYHGLRVQRKRVIHSVKQVDSVGHALRVHKTIKRRKYSVQRPNSLWHLDGHHKLITWGIVIHGIIDGYFCTVCELGN
jgi:hypothetical protein